MLDTSIEVPVVLFVFNRYNQLPKTLECLRKNRISKLIVFADGPRNKADAEGIQKVRALIDEITWTDVSKHYQKKNKGLSQSIQDGLDEVFSRFNRVIILEDDVCVAPQFYNYMCACLEMYEADERIAGVTGLRYPFSRKHLKTDSADIFLAPRFSSWGWGTWKRQWQALSFDSKKLIDRLAPKKFQLEAGGTDLPHAVNEMAAGRLTGSWDVVFYMNMVLNEQFFVWPKQNLVINTGFTEGSHGNEDLKLNWKLRWEKKFISAKAWQLPAEPSKNDRILKDFLAFFDPARLYQLPRGQRIKNRLFGKGYRKVS